MSFEILNCAGRLGYIDDLKWITFKVTASALMQATTFLEEKLNEKNCFK